MAASFAKFFHILSLRDNDHTELASLGGARGHKKRRCPFETPSFADGCVNYFLVRIKSLTVLLPASTLMFSYLTVSYPSFVAKIEYVPAGTPMIA